MQPVRDFYLANLQIFLGAYSDTYRHGKRVECHIRHACNFTIRRFYEESALKYAVVESVRMWDEIEIGERSSLQQRRSSGRYHLADVDLERGE